MTTHPRTARLHDYADGLLLAGESHAVEAHLAECVACRRSVDRLGDLMGELRALPRDITPPRGLGPPALDPAGDGAQQRDVLHPWLRAAAGIIALLGAGALVWFAAAGPAGRTPVATERAAATGPVAVAVAVPVEPYAEATRDLFAVFEARRSELAPEAVELVQRNLAVVDAAIRELERARARAPNAAGLSRLLEARYRTKLELLRGVALLVPES